MSLRQAINEYCKYCIYDPGHGNGGWLQQVDDCTEGNCPLYAVRPMPKNNRKTAVFSGPEETSHATHGKVLPSASNTRDELSAGKAK